VLYNAAAMAPWQIAALGAACFVAGHYLLLRAAAGRIGDALGALVLEGVAAAGIAIAYLLGVRGGTTTTRAGVTYALLSGLCISAATILLFFALRRGGPVASTGTMILGGGVTLSAIAAPFLFAEPMTGRRIVGVALGVAALVVLATERSPGERIESSEAATPRPEHGDQR
jgi:bacterial/archaeal transporter family protein